MSPFLSVLIKLQVDSVFKLYMWLLTCMQHLHSTGFLDGRTSMLVSFTFEWENEICYTLVLVPTILP